MKKAIVEIEATFGSKFQEQFARDSLMAVLKEWKRFLNHSHKGNDVSIKINEQPISILEWFDFEKVKK